MRFLYRVVEKSSAIAAVRCYQTCQQVDDTDLRLLAQKFGFQD